MSFNHAHVRAKKSRLTVGLQPFITIFKLLKIVAIITGLILILLEDSIGWLILAAATIPLMLENWWRGELHRLAPIQNGSSPEDWLASNILGKLGENPTAEQIAKIVMESSGGRFIVSRFGLGQTTIESLATISQNSPENIFATANEIHKKLETNTISGSVLVLAIIKNYPDHENLLAQFHLDFEDLERGVK